ncbi:MAG: succinate dehydrogenase, cytochrome b556 subunit [Rhizobacter sp.]|nr:succinate dehydrogenase, cytochrome b556 subunit [Burkholderiaceae bacterium]MCO5123665.1 succinate dehydrogenase, cytochrome b556 subunit [Rhizobacter sp.]
MAETAKTRPGAMRLWDARQYRLPLAALVSILHRASGLLIFLLLPFIIWMFDTSLTSEVSFDDFRSVFIAGAWFMPAWFIKLVVLALIWAALHHIIAGLRHVFLDVTHRVDKDFGRRTAAFTLAAGVVLTLLLGARLFGIY